METRPGEGAVKEEKFPNSRKHPHGWVCGEFWNLRGQHNWETKKTKNKNKNNHPQNPCLTATASGEVAQRLELATGKQGLDREAWPT